MTPKRKEALQWFHDNPAASARRPDAPSSRIISLALKDGELKTHGSYRYSLTDLGRRRLHGDEV